MPKSITVYSEEEYNDLEERFINLQQEHAARENLHWSNPEPEMQTSEFRLYNVTEGRWLSGSEVKENLSFNWQEESEGVATIWGYVYEDDDGPKIVMVHPNLEGEYTEPKE